MAWLIIGILIGVLLVFMVNNRYVKLGWLDWTLVAVAMVFFVLAIANYTGSMEELEPRAAGFLLASFGIPEVILVAIAGIRVWRKQTQHETTVSAGKS